MAKVELGGGSLGLVLGVFSAAGAGALAEALDDFPESVVRGGSAAAGLESGAADRSVAVFAGLPVAAAGPETHPLHRLVPDPFIHWRNRLQD